MPALPASATSALIDTEVERREIIMARAAGRIFRRRAGTTGLEAANLSPDKRLLLPLSYVPMHSAGGIRTHGLELMRLARTATPLRRST